MSMAFRACQGCLRQRWSGWHELMHGTCWVFRTECADIHLRLFWLHQALVLEGQSGGKSTMMGC